MTESAAGRPTTPSASLRTLLEGNARFVHGTPAHPNQGADHRTAIASGQTPYAVIFGCSDSRLAAEIIFDQGLGDLFVVRTAGHTAGPEVLGSIEYAVTVLQAPVVVVLGHNSCGAVTAACEATDSGVAPGGFITALVEAIAPSVELAHSRKLTAVDDIVDIHIERTVTDLQLRSRKLALAVAQGKCAVVGMSYHLDAGRVVLLEGDQLSRNVSI